MAHYSIVPPMAVQMNELRLNTLVQLCDLLDGTVKIQSSGSSATAPDAAASSARVENHLGNAMTGHIGGDGTAAECDGRLPGRK